MHSHIVVFLLWLRCGNEVLLKGLNFKILDPRADLEHVQAKPIHKNTNILETV